MILEIDNREPKNIQDIINSRIKNIELKNLDIGDFKIINKNNNVVMIFERKSLNDLIASVKDGRYNEQSFRLDETPLENNKIFYIIEGNIMNFCQNKSESIQKTIFSCMLSLSYKKGFSIINTMNEIETAEYIIRFYEKISSKGYLEENTQSYNNTLKTTKKSKISKDNINQIMLMQIPGISQNIADALIENFESIENLIFTLKNEPEKLDNFKIKNKSGERKISKAIIQSLNELLT